MDRKLTIKYELTQQILDPLSDDLWSCNLRSSTEWILELPVTLPTSSSVKVLLCSDVLENVSKVNYWPKRQASYL